MIQNNVEYKLIKLDDLEFSVRLYNVARRNSLNTLYDLIESYNSGEFAKLRNVGKNTVEELENYDFSTIPAIHTGDEEKQEEDTNGVIQSSVDWDDILPASYLNDSIENYIFDSLLVAYFRGHEKMTMRDVLQLSDDEMREWQRFGQVKRQLVFGLRDRALNGEECVIFGGEVKAVNEIEPTREIDWYVLNLLKNEFGLRYVWLCDWYGVTRQCVDQKVKKASRRRTGKWCGFGYSDSEEATLINMLKGGKTEYSNGEEYFYFLTNGDGKYAVLIVNATGIRCVFEEDIHGDLKDFILNNRLNELSFRENEIIENGSQVSILKVEYFVPNNKDITDFSSYAKKRGMSREEYALFLTGKPYAKDFSITDEKILDFFEKHLNDQGKVYISADPSNQWIKSYASRKGYKISEFIELYGYQSALAGDMLTSEGARRRHLETIQNYVVHDNVVYIPTYCDFYRILNAYSAKRGITISDYVAELGYERTLTPGEFTGALFGGDESINSDESDMEIYEGEGSFLQKIFASNPLLGNYIFSENNLQVLHNKAKKAIDEMVAGRGKQLSPEQKMSVALSVINYAKHWDTGLGTFTNYITKQYAYRSEDRVYPRIMTATYEALRENRRWTFSIHGSNQYKSTVMIHAMGSTRSWMHLCDFLSDFYQNNLGCHYEENDPYVLNMVMYMRGLFYNSELGADDETDIEISVGSKPYRFQEGIRKLVVYRPNYAAKVFDRMLKRIHGYMNSDVTPSKKYEDTLVDLWFKNKTEYYFKYKRNVERSGGSVSHRIAFDYTHIRLDYKFSEDTIYIDVPDIRLASPTSDACFFEIYSHNELIDRRSLKCYGNELGRTISGFTYSLSDYISIVENGEISPQIMIKCGDTVIYDSAQKLRRKIILFSGEREKELSSVEVGGYVVVSPTDIDISGSCIETSIIKTIGGFKYQFIDLQDDYSLVVDDIIVSFDRRKTEKIRVNLPHYVKGASYVEDGLEYSICKSNGEISIAVDENDVEQKYVILLNGKRIAFSDLKCNSGEGMNVYTMPSQSWENDKNRLQVVDFSCNKIAVDKWFIFIPSFSFEFDSKFYYLDSEIQDCCLEYSIAGEDYEITNEGLESILSADYLGGVIQFEIPIVRLIDLEGNDWIKKEYFINEIDRGLYLRLNSVPGVIGRISVGDTEVQRDIMGLFTLGNTLYSLMDPKSETLKLVLADQDGQTKTYNLGKILFKEQFTAAPHVEYVEDRLMWDCGYGFVGDKSKDTFIQITGENSEIIFEGTLDLDVSLIADKLSIPDGMYKYSIFRESEDLFSLEKTELAQGCLVCGNYDKVRFNNSRIVISQIVFDNAVSTGVVSIMPVYIDNIQYDEALSKEEGSEGICPTYSGTMYFINPEGKRHDYAFEDEYRSEKDIRVKTNPVRIVYINDNVLLVTDSDDDALMYRFYYDKYTHEKIHHITDHKPSAFDQGNYDTVDLLRYGKESL